MAYPLLVENGSKVVNPSRFQLPDCVKYSSFSQQVDVEKASPLDKGFDFLFKVLAAAGYQPRNSMAYESCSYIMVNGSVPWHVDTSLGLVASTLVYLLDEVNDEVVSPAYESIQLLTARDKPFIEPGQVFVFNANAGHAWISPYRCVLAQVTIKRTSTTN